MTIAVDPSFDWLNELPLAPGPPDLRMGTRSLDVGDWFPADTKTPNELALRAQLLTDHPEFVQIESGHDAALEELLSLATIHLGDRLDRSRETPLECLAVSVPDDILLMHRDTAHWRLIGGALLFPNQWTLDEKMGQSVASIHSPVDGYDELLETRVDQFFDRLSPARPVWRRNWFFHDRADFFQPERWVQTPMTDPSMVESLWVRSEWQTLRRLAFSEVIVFTVKTQIASMRELKARPAIAEQMRVFLESATPRSLENKDAVGREQAILDYLSAGEQQPGV